MAEIRRLVDARCQLALHEMRQPLAAVRALVEAARVQGGLPPDVRGYLDQIVDQVEEVSGAASSVLSRETPATSVDVDDLIESAFEAFRLTWSGTLIRRGDRGDLVTNGDRAALRRCLVNVLDNAVRAAGPAGRVTVTVRRGTCICVDVEDDGPGFGHIARRSGLGLAATRQVLQALGGNLSVDAVSGTGGARVVLAFPTSPALGHGASVPTG